ncbi:hypothetical protein JCGZ_11022 [Jatropha curcas]|uniref:Uncharacterized protein n=1 Tax=Jatropha curcas TaxID=180498 RepID=A0A067KS85_JATCU|nr:hypothetical protein JCGZ_11022 [Jatropha curcas]
MDGRETSGDGAGPLRLTDGSIFAIETSQSLAEKLNCEPTPMEVFTFSHIKDYDGETFIDRNVMGINAGVAIKSTVDELVLYLQDAGGENKRNVYEIGSHVSQFYKSSINAPVSASSRLQPDPKAKEISALQARIDDQERQLAELRAHVMQMSRLNSAAAFSNPLTSSDPPVSPSSS